MTLFAVICAGVFPLLARGASLLYSLNPIRWRFGTEARCVWDLFAVRTYFTVSLIFWYIGVVRDLATVRDLAQTKWKKILYGLGALG